MSIVRPDGRPWFTSHAAASRVWEGMMLHRLALSWDEIAAWRWGAFSLADGSTDNTPYASMLSAASAQKGDPNRYMYLRLGPTFPGLGDCDTLLYVFRQRYDHNYRPAGKDAGVVPIVPIMREKLS